MDVEIVVQDQAGARIAHGLGAQRVELSSALGVGGLTPSIGLIRRCVAIGIPVHVLIRPRAGGFVYSPEEVELVEDDIRASMAVGAAGVVVGALTPDQTALNLPALRRWIDAAGDGSVTVHRCMDVIIGTGGSVAALTKDLTQLGVTRVLTSGGAPRVADGLENIGKLCNALGGQVAVMAGGGATVRDIPALAALGVSSIHLSARMPSTHAGATGPGGGQAAFSVTDPDVVRAAILAAQEAGASIT